MEKIKIISAAEFLKQSKNKKPNQEEVWDEISDLWNEYRKEPFDAVKDFLKNKRGKIIDLGCGSGRNMIKSNDIEYYGVDISSNQLKAAEKHIKNDKINAILIKNSADKLDKQVFKNEMFDYGLFIATLHCIETKKQRENALNEFYRVLKKRAEAIISVWNSEDERFNGLKGDIYMGWRKNNEEYYRYYYLYDKDELIDLLKSAGFSILDFNTKLEQTDRFSKKNLIIRIKK